MCSDAYRALRTDRAEVFCTYWYVRLFLPPPSAVWFRRPPLQPLLAAVHVPSAASSSAPHSSLARLQSDYPALSPRRRPPPPPSVCRSLPTFRAILHSTYFAALSAHHLEMPQPQAAGIPPKIMTKKGWGMMTRGRGRSCASPSLLCGRERQDGDAGGDGRD